MGASKKKNWKRVGIAAVALVALATAEMAFAPVVYLELARATHSRLPWPSPLIFGAPLASAIDDHWRVQKIARDSFAIAEPQLLLRSIHSEISILLRTDDRPV